MKVRALMLAVAIVAMALVFSWDQAPRAVACSCVALTPAEQADMADVVGRGTVVDVERPERPSSSADDATYTVELSEAWKGDPSGTVRVLTAVEGPSCGWEGIEEGMEIVLFARSDGDVLRSNLCDGSGPVTDELVAAVTDHLGEPVAVAPSDSLDPVVPTGSSDPGLLSDPALVGVAVALLSAAGIAVWFLRRRR